MIGNAETQLNLTKGRLDILDPNYDLVEEKLEAEQQDEHEQLSCSSLILRLVRYQRRLGPALHLSCQAKATNGALASAFKRLHSTPALRAISEAFVGGPW